MDEIYMGKVYGLRGYTLRHGRHNWFFQGGYSTRWYSPRQKAKCDLETKDPCYPGIEKIEKGKPKNTAPCDNEGHRCGINAFRMDKFMEDELVEDGWGTFKTIHTALVSQYSGKGFNVFVGVAELWGKIHIGPRGYRAEQCRIVHMLCNCKPVRHQIPNGWNDVPFTECNMMDKDEIALILMSNGFLDNQLVQIPKEEM